MNFKNSLFKISYLLFIFTAMNLFSSCKPDFSVNAPWKEIMVVYGLLDPSDSATYIKINKAFLGDANAYTMAQNPDSFNYAPGQIEARLNQINTSGNLVKSILLVRDESITRPSGTFANTPNVLYKTTDPIVQDGSSYTLEVHNTSTGKTVTSSTPIIGKVSVNTPSGAQTIDWENHDKAPKSKFVVSWNPTVGGRIYGLTIRFHYTDINRINPADSSQKFVDWIFPEVVSDNATATSPPIKQFIYGDDFYKFIAVQIPVNSEVKRTAGRLEFIIIVGAEELYNYLEINKPSTSIVQDKPIYTNIKDGLGIFSSRFRYSHSMNKMSVKALDLLSTGEYTSQLGFE